jgi:hypothetical protein
VACLIPWPASLRGLPSQDLFTEPSLDVSVSHQVWDMSEFRGLPSQDFEVASSKVREVALWRGHKSIVSSVDWVDGGEQGR